MKARAYKKAIEGLLNKGEKLTICETYYYYRYLAEWIIALIEGDE